VQHPHYEARAIQAADQAERRADAGSALRQRGSPTASNTAAQDQQTLASLLRVSREQASQHHARRTPDTMPLAEDLTPAPAPQPEEEGPAEPIL